MLVVTVALRRRVNVLMQSNKISKQILTGFIIQLAFVNLYHGFFDGSWCRRLLWRRNCMTLLSVNYEQVLIYDLRWRYVMGNSPSLPIPIIFHEAQERWCTNISKITLLSSSFHIYPCNNHRRYWSNYKLWWLILTASISTDIELCDG